MLSDSREPSDGREQDWLGPIPRGGVEWSGAAKIVSAGQPGQSVLAPTASCQYLLPPSLVPGHPGLPHVWQGNIVLGRAGQDSEIS